MGCSDYAGWGEEEGREVGNGGAGAFCAAALLVGGLKSGGDGRREGGRRGKKATSGEKWTSAEESE